VAQPSQQRQVKTGEVELNVRVSGEGPAVLLLHGFPDSGDLWRDVTPQYAHAGLEQKRKGLYTILWQFRGLAEAWLSRNNFAGMRSFARGHPDLDACVRAMSRPGRLTAGLNWYRANLVQVLFGKWPACQVPTLGIWSSGDPHLVEGQMRQSGRRMTAAWNYVRIDDAGHWLPLEQPQRIAALAVDWFDKQETRA